MSKNRALFTFQEEKLPETIKNILDKEYQFIFSDNEDEILSLLIKVKNNISIVFLWLDDLIENDFSFVKKMNSNPHFSSYPLVVITDKTVATINTDFISYGISELISPPYYENLVLLRVRNAIRGKDSISFKDVEKILKQLPSNIYLKDKEGRYIFATHIWHHLDHCDDPDFLIRGKTDIEIRKDKENALKAMESDKKVIETGKGIKYTIEEHSDNVTEYLELIKEPVFDEDGKVNGIVTLINDITDNQLLKKELERRSMIDQLTGIYNRFATGRAIEYGIKTHCKECAYMDIDVDVFKHINDTYGHLAGDAVLAKVAALLKEAVRSEDVVGRMGGDEFVVFLQDIDSNEDAIIVAERIEKKVKEAIYFDNPEIKVSLSIGISIFPKDGEDIEILYSKADKALYYVKNHGRSSYHFYDDELK